VNEQITADVKKERKSDSIDRRGALRRSGLIFLGGFAAASLGEAPASAQGPVHIIDDIPWGIAWVARPPGALSPSPSPSTSPPATLAAYATASYVAVVAKRYNDTKTGHPGVPTSDDLANLHMPIPAGLNRLASFRIPSSHVPYVFGSDPTSRGYLQRQQFGPGGREVVGAHGPYDIFILVYG
jgi:hypothetical protein